MQQNAAVSAVAIPASLILAFLGINASQVSSTRSMFSHQYLGMYLTVAAVIVLDAVLSLGGVRAAAPGRPPPPDQRPEIPVDAGT